MKHTTEQERKYFEQKKKKKKKKNIFSKNERPKNPSESSVHFGIQTFAFFLK